MCVEIYENAPLPHFPSDDYSWPTLVVVGMGGEVGNQEHEGEVKKGEEKEEEGGGKQRERQLSRYTG